MPATSQLTIALIEEQVKRSLGGGSIDVEIDTADVVVCLRAALRHYNRCRPQRENLAVAMTTDQKKYGPLNDTASKAIF